MATAAPPVASATTPAGEPAALRVVPSAREVLVLALALLFHGAFFAWFPSLHPPNELARIYLASALVEDGVVHVDRQLRRDGVINDLAVRTTEGRRHYYCDKAPGVSFLSVPVLAVYEAVASAPTLAGKVRLVRLWVSTLPSVLLLALLLVWLRAHLQERRLASSLLLAYALGSVATPYASLAFGHQLSAVVLFSLFMVIRGASPQSSHWRSAAVGALASLAVNVEYQNALLLVPFAVFYVLRVRARALQLASGCAGMAPLMGVLLAYHDAAFGSPLLTGYSFLATPFKAVHEQGMLGVVWPAWAAAELSFTSPAKGLWFFAPWLALALPGSFVLVRSRSAEARFVVAFLIAYGLFVSALVYPVGGWTVSQRHLVPALPFMLLPIGLLVERLGTAGRVLFVGLALPGMLACGVSSVVWPHWQEHLQNPFWQLGWPLFVDGWVVPSVLAPLGVSAWWLAVVLLGGAALFLLGELAAMQRRLSLRVAAPVLALALSAGYVAFARMPGRDQDVRADRTFIERHYAPDPHSVAAGER